MSTFDSEDDDSAMEVNSDSDIDPMSEIEVELAQNLWLNDGLISHVSNKPWSAKDQLSMWTSLHTGQFWRFMSLMF